MCAAGVAEPSTMVDSAGRDFDSTKVVPTFGVEKLIGDAQSSIVRVRFFAKRTVVDKVPLTVTQVE